ncbi:MAG: acyltransferase domain-containing protein [Spirochaetaceae bacterium]|nr:acyltransferase domain-containing protein [Spirochaetaceae bacterium]
MDGIAIIGMSLNVPGAVTIDKFWKNLSEGKDTIKRKDLDKEGEIYAKGIIEDIETFDCSFFGISPQEAAYMDPQQRKWLELVWHSIEDAGLIYNNMNNIGVFASAGFNYYLLNNVLINSEVYSKISAGKGETLIESIGGGNDFIATRTSYLLDLKGPSFTIQSACSSSLVAIHQAVQSLLNYETDICLAGGISILHPQDNGYFASDGGMRSTDGYCRPFDENANGTVFSSGGGVILLKRLEDAIEDGDRIYSVIRSSAINNDGSNKASYTAPSSMRQAEVIRMAQDLAEIDFKDIGYIETHGTGTPLGDPIEYHGLKLACSDISIKSGNCALGSIKGNIGHTDVASGVISVIKTALILNKRQILPLAHFSKPNREIVLENSPFYIPTSTLEWPGNGIARAGVSSFGVGGTNAHIIMEELIHNNIPTEKSSKNSIFLFNAKTEESLKSYIDTFRDWCSDKSDDEISRASSTLFYKRHQMAFQSYAYWTGQELVEPKNLSSTISSNKKTAWIFPGQGSQFPGMAGDLYNKYPVFKDNIDICGKIILHHTQVDIKEYLLNEEVKNPDIFTETTILQPLLFAFEYSLSLLLISLGLKYDKIAGHSLGEYVIAVLEGIFSVDGAIEVLIHRGRFMQDSPKGEMVAIMCSREQIDESILENVEIGALNSPSQFVISGTEIKITQVLDTLDKLGLQYKKISEKYAFHSSLMETASDELVPILKRFIHSNISSDKGVYSTLTGKQIDIIEMCEPSYWADQMKNTVLFNKCIKSMNDGDTIFLEVGPGNVLTQLISEITALEDITISTAIKQKGSSDIGLLNLLCIFAQLKYPVNLRQIIKRESILSLPGYSFEKQVAWIGPENYNSNNCDMPKMGNMESSEEDFEDKLQKIFQPQGWDFSSEQDFWELGIDSLVLSQLSIQIREAFDVNISFRDLIIKYKTPQILKTYLAKMIKEKLEL